MTTLLGKKMFKVVETFSGIGAQAKALERLPIEHEIIHTCDWDVGAILAYCQIHKGSIDNKKYDDVSDSEIEAFLSNSTLSLDGKKPANPKTIHAFSAEIKRMIYAAIQETNNLVSITDVHGEELEDDIDLLTYSFPCQDLSLCGYWHGEISGISREAHNRSGMLWEVERILKEMHTAGKTLPKFLVMENVTNILSATHKKDFDDWKNTLNALGYYNHIYRLNAKNFGVPQKRERAYMISIYVGMSLNLEGELNNYFAYNNLEVSENAERYRTRKFILADALRIDHTHPKYYEEAIASQPNNTPSREKIWRENEMLYDGTRIKNTVVNTVTTKQDRNPNSGLITFNSGREGKAPWRYLTPRECFMLMGFDEEDYERALSYNPEYVKGKKLISVEKAVKMAGNSICVDVLEAIFRQIIEIRDTVM